MKIKPFIALGSAILFISMIYAAAYQWPAFKSFVKFVIKPVQVWRAGGEDLYRKKIIGNQALVAAKVAPPTTVIETSRLPIIVEYVALPQGFAEGAGAITRVSDRIIITSRLGQFYQYKTGIFSKIYWPKIPNKIEEYIASSTGPLNSDSFRVSSVAYNESDHRLYAAYTRFVTATKNRLVVSSLEIDPVTLKPIGKWEDLFESESVSADYGSQAGGGRVLVHNGRVYFSVGYSEQATILDGKSVPASQNPASSLGKIFQIDAVTLKVSPLSMGHRNVQGMAFTRSGELLASEHGPQGGDEINLIQKGSNYGWPFSTYGTDYGKYNYTSSFKVPTKFISSEPVYAFVPSMGISPLMLIEDFHPAWNGDLLLGSLKAQSLFRLVFRSQRIIVSEPIWIGHRIRDFATYPGNKIVLLTDDSLLAFLSVDADRLRENNKNSGYNFEPKLARCLVCHHFETSTPASVAPSLKNVFGRKIGGDTFEKYSSGMKSASGKWDKKKLSAYIKNPQSVIPGTSMPNLGLSPEEVEDIVEIISK